MNKTITILLATAIGSLALAQSNMPGMKTNTPSHDMSTMSAPTTPGMMGMDMNSMTSAMNSLTKLTGRSFDRAFLSMMVPHHMAAVAMSKAVLPVSQDEQVKGWANAIITSQQEEITTMNALLRPYGGPNITLRALMQKSMGGMAGMVKVAKDPDLAFVQGMLPHHSSAIDMAKLALGKSTDAQVLKLSRDIVVAQAGEMYDFQIWLSRR
jgi:uncharacterized protein (DUF305 family)